MINSLEGKKILFFSPSFFNYENEIKQELERLGANVFLFDERPSNDFFTKVLIRLGHKWLLKRRISKYYSSIIGSVESVAFDYLFLLNPETIKIEHINRIKAANPSLKVLLYMWDSVKNKPKSLTYLPHVNRFLSFDPRDHNDINGIEFLPLFYTRQYSNEIEQVQTNYDVSFVGSVHSERYKIVKLVSKSLNSSYIYFYSPSKLLFLLQKVFDSNIRCVEFSDVNFRPLSAFQLIDIVSKSRAIIDIEHSEQVGLTMRSLEVLGAKRKLITTNSSIVNYDFYDKNNILVVDRNAPEIPCWFLEAPYHELPKSVYESYSLNSWLKKIFF